ncbi:hypothetical protein DdX_17880 [Ditylenchus destructor]|uniref:Uncharacterized protein n=1 Tax=Ditylenchus destructor TaxID=166010 RepID=A0AAD4QT59_9BILA|nr:hypothetical protein DdX_17880 [Ditylenchus destructor]
MNKFFLIVLLIAIVCIALMSAADIRHLTDLTKNVDPVSERKNVQTNFISDQDVYKRPENPGHNTIKDSTRAEPNLKSSHGVPTP